MVRGSPFLFALLLIRASASPPPAYEVILLLILCVQLLLRAVRLSRLMNFPSLSPPGAGTPGVWASSVVSCIGQSGSIFHGYRTLPLMGRSAGLGTYEGRSRARTSYAYSIWWLMFWLKTIHYVEIKLHFLMLALKDVFFYSYLRGNWMCSLLWPSVFSLLLEEKVVFSLSLFSQSFLWQIERKQTQYFYLKVFIPLNVFAMYWTCAYMWYFKTK